MKALMEGKDSDRVHAYHFTTWIFHAAGQRILRMITNRLDRAARREMFANVACDHFMKIMKVGRLMAPKQGKHCFSKPVERLAGDGKNIWFTVDRTFSGFTRTLHKWSFGFVYDAELLVREFDAHVRDSDFVNDYSNMLGEVMHKQVGIETSSMRSDDVWQAFEQLQEGDRLACGREFELRAKAFRENNEYAGPAALNRIKRRPAPYELVVRKVVPIEFSKAIIVGGVVHEKGKTSNTSGLRDNRTSKDADRKEQ